MNENYTCFDAAFFRENGYQVIRSVLPKEVVDSVGKFLQVAVEESLSSVKEELDYVNLRSFIDSLSKRDKSWLGGLSPGCQHIVSGHFSLETRLSQVIWEIPRAKKLREILSAALKSEDLFLHMPPTARFVLPGNAHAGVPAHQDISYNRHLSHFLTCWVPLVATDDTCGGVEIFEGTGNLSEVPVSKAGFWLDGVPDGEYRQIHFPMNPGDVLLLNPFVLHRSKPNQSDKIRLSIDFRFFGKQGSSSKHYLNMQSWQVLAPQS